MGIPNLDDDGFLPAGVYVCTLDEVRGVFGVFQRTDQRPRLYGRLEQFTAEVQSTGLAAAILIDGSFVTGCDNPNDIDLILVLRGDHDFSVTLPPFKYNVLSRRHVRKSFGFDLLVAAEDSPELDEYVAFFKQVRGTPDREKGILRVDL